MPKKALIYGISGQDGHYLSGLLQSKGYAVHGVSQHKPEGAGGAGFTPADLAGEGKAYLLPLGEFAPDEVYFLAGVNSRGKVLESPEAAFRVNALAPIAIMQEMHASLPKAKFFHASSAYIFGARQGKVDEKTAPMPNSIYGITKLSAHLMAQQFRQGGMFACNGILFNHESPLRQPDFVTRKITRAAAAISRGAQKGKLMLGNLDAMRDWGFAGDYVEAMWLMLQQKSPGDYIIATGESHSVREFCAEAFSQAGLDWEKHVKVEKSLVRKGEKSAEADISKARRELGWAPKARFKEVVRMMMDADLEAIGR
jgi:GDPmannose 4,6-dehydratase